MVYQLPISVKGIVFEGDGLWLRKNERQEWELPGGKVEEGETLEHALEREILEELGLEIAVGSVIDAHITTERNPQNVSSGVLVLSYLCRIKERVQDVESNGEGGIAEFNKFVVDDMMNLPMPSFYKRAIMKVVY